MVEKHLSDWSGGREDVQPDGEPELGYQHTQADTSQVHIALAYDAVPEPDDNSILQRAAVATLSGGIWSWGGSTPTCFPAVG